MNLRAGVLLDRDGTIIVDRGYLSDPREVYLEPFADQGLRSMAAAGWVLAIVTNQSGIGRGFFDRATANAVNASLAVMLSAAGVQISGWYVCPHRPEDECDCRKPRPGLARQAADALGLDLARSWVIGDKRSDLELAHAVGARSLLVLTGEGEAHRAWASAHDTPVCATLREAAYQIGGAPTAAMQGVRTAAP